MKKYLYSVIWFEDPAVSEQSELTIGSILQILKNQSFDKLFLWRVHAVTQSSNYKLKESRLKELVKEQYQIPVEFHDLEKEGINEVGRWKDIFYHSISHCLRQESTDDVLWYVNFSSGTPMMISSLTHAILSINQPLWAIYVNETDYPLSKKYEITKKAIVQSLEKTTSGITVAPIKQLQETAIQSQIKQLLEIKSYRAASLLLKEFSSTYYQTLKAMCEGADACMELDITSAKKYWKYTPLHALFTHQTPDEVIQLLVYTANLQNKAEQKEYFDFVMRISPLLYELCITIFLDYAKFPKEAITTTDAYASSVIKRKHLSLIPVQFRSFFTNYFYKNPNAEHVILTTPLMITLISYQLSGHLSIVNELNTLRSFEEKIRNEFAHVFSNYSVSYIQQKTGYTPETIISLLKQVIRKIFHGYIQDDSIFDLYHTINETIYHYIEIET